MGSLSWIDIPLPRQSKLNLQEQPMTSSLPNTRDCLSILHNSQNACGLRVSTRQQGNDKFGGPDPLPCWDGHQYRRNLRQRQRQRQRQVPPTLTAVRNKKVGRLNIIQIQAKAIMSAPLLTLPNMSFCRYQRVPKAGNN